MYCTYFPSVRSFHHWPLLLMIHHFVLILRVKLTRWFMYLKPLQHRRHNSTIHVKIDLASRPEPAEVILDDCEDYLKVQSSHCPDMLDSTTLAGLEQRLYHRFKDSIRNQKLQEANPIEQIDKQNMKIGHVKNKLSQSSLISHLSDNNPEISQLSNKLNALEKTYLNQRAGRVISRKPARRPFGQLSLNDMAPANLTQEIAASISGLPNSEKIHKMFKWHNQLLRTSEQIQQTNDQLVVKRTQQTNKLLKIEKLQSTLRDEINQSKDQTAQIQNLCRELEDSIDDILEKEKAKWMIELEDEDRILERLNMF